VDHKNISLLSVHNSITNSSTSLSTESIITAGGHSYMIEPACAAGSAGAGTEHQNSPTLNVIRSKSSSIWNLN